MANYYQTLGVNPKAAEAEIRKAYRSLARKYHPDVNPGDKDAEDRLKQINEAYAVLSNSESRHKYDLMGNNCKPADWMETSKTKQWTCGPVDVVIDVRVGLLDDFQEP